MGPMPLMPEGALWPTVGYGLNKHNQVVGVISGHAFYYNGISVADLGTLGGAESVAMAINTYSEIVGEADTADGKEHAFLFTDGQMYDLGAGQANAINDDRTCFLARRSLPSRFCGTVRCIVRPS